MASQRAQTRPLATCRPACPLDLLVWKDFFPLKDTRKTLGRQKSTRPYQYVAAPPSSHGERPTWKRLKKEDSIGLYTLLKDPRRTWFVPERDPTSGELHVLRWNTAADRRDIWPNLQGLPTRDPTLSQPPLPPLYPTIQTQPDHQGAHQDEELLRQFDESLMRELRGGRYGSDSDGDTSEEEAPTPAEPPAEDPNTSPDRISLVASRLELYESLRTRATDADTGNAGAPRLRRSNSLTTGLLRAPTPSRPRSQSPILAPTAETGSPARPDDAANPPAPLLSSSLPPTERDTDTPLASAPEEKEEDPAGGRRSPQTSSPAAAPPPTTAAARTDSLLAAIMASPPHASLDIPNPADLENEKVRRLGRLLATFMLKKAALTRDALRRETCTPSFVIHGREVRIHGTGEREKAVLGSLNRIMHAASMAADAVVLNYLHEECIERRAAIESEIADWEPTHSQQVAVAHIFWARHGPIKAAPVPAEPAPLDHFILVENNASTRHSTPSIIPNPAMKKRWSTTGERQPGQNVVHTGKNKAKNKNNPPTKPPQATAAATTTPEAETEPGFHAAGQTPDLEEQQPQQQQEDYQSAFREAWRRLSKEAAERDAEEHWTRVHRRPTNRERRPRQTAAPDQQNPPTRSRRNPQPPRGREQQREREQQRPRQQHQQRRQQQQQRRPQPQQQPQRRQPQHPSPPPPPPPTTNPQPNPDTFWAPLRDMMGQLLASRTPTGPPPPQPPTHQPLTYAQAAAWQPQQGFLVRA